MTRSQQAIDCALRALEDVAANKSCDPHSRVSAAKVILDFVSGGGSLSADELPLREGDPSDGTLVTGSLQKLAAGQ